MNNYELLDNNNFIDLKVILTVLNLKVYNPLILI